MKPQEISDDRAAQHQEGERPQKPSARHDVADVGEREGYRQQHNASGEILDAIADPETALWREHFEQDRTSCIRPPLGRPETGETDQYSERTHAG